MDRMLYVAMSGAKQTMAAQAINAHNMANVNTTGFRADFAAMRSQPVFGDGHPSRAYAQTERPGTDFRPGVIAATGRSLDIGIKGEGWMAVQGRDGREAYTRAGDLRMTANGVLVTGAGHPVMGNIGPIALPPSIKVEIGDDGTISIQQPSSGPEALAVVDRIKFVKPPLESLEKGDDGLMHLKSDQLAPADGSVRVASGMLEHSNVNAVGSMVNMIELARQFEMQIKMMHTVEQNDRSSTELMQIA